MSDRCERCGSVGSDRRNLWMACLYAMNELSVPFRQVNIYGVVQRKIGDETLSALNIKVPVFEKTPEVEQRNHPMFTLFVCKRCRAEWMRAIERWFHEPPQGEDGDADEPVLMAVSDQCTYCGTEDLQGIWIRRDGDTVPICRKCWDREYAASPK